jgi:hypothetical protein
MKHRYWAMSTDHCPRGSRRKPPSSTHVGVQEVPFPQGDSTEIRHIIKSLRSCSSGYAFRIVVPKQVYYQRVNRTREFLYIKPSSPWRIPTSGYTVRTIRTTILHPQPFRKHPKSHAAMARLVQLSSIKPPQSTKNQRRIDGPKTMASMTRDSLLPDALPRPTPSGMSAEYQLTLTS